MVGFIRMAVWAVSVSRVQQLVTQAKVTFSLSKSEPKYLQELEKLKRIVRPLAIYAFLIFTTLIF